MQEVAIQNNVTAFDQPGRTDVLIPEEIDDMVAAANASQSQAESHQWHTAAMVYAWTYDTGGGRPTKSSQNCDLLTLADFASLGIRGLQSKNTVARYRKAMQWAIDNGHCVPPLPGGSVSLPAAEFPALASSRHGGLTGEIEWYTPPEIIERVHRVLGEIDIDPASNPTANKVVQAKTFYTEDDNGLDPDKLWQGVAFCNPPFSHPTCKFFAERMIAEYQAGNVTEAILLIQANCDLGYWHELIRNSVACLTRGRIKFYNGTERNNPTLGQAIFYFGSNQQRFIDEFADLGVIVEAVQ